MLMHLSRTKTLKKFSGKRQQQREGAQQPISSNIVAFPIPSTHPAKKDQKQPVLDWTERLITKRQLCYIRLLASQQNISILILNNACYKQYGAYLTTMKRTEASDVIQSLKRSLNQEYKPFH